jgi:hypothetical protein
MKVILILYSLFLMTPSSNKSGVCDSGNLIGAWEILSIEVIRDPTQITEDSRSNLITLFGVEPWVEAVGKYFDFTASGDLNTDIMEPFRSLKGLSEEDKEAILNPPLKYTCDTNLTIYLEEQTDPMYNVNVDIVSLDKKKMIWEVGKIYNVVMIKK